jgi:hypothetical protein
LPGLRRNWEWFPHLVQSLPLQSPGIHSPVRVIFWAPWHKFLDVLVGG